MPDNVTKGVVAFDPERTMAATKKDMVTKMVNDISTDTTNRVGGGGGGGDWEKDDNQATYGPKG